MIAVTAPGNVLSILVTCTQDNSRPASISQRGSGSSATRVPSILVGTSDASSASGVPSAGNAPCAVPISPDPVLVAVCTPVLALALIW